MNTPCRHSEAALRALAQDDLSRELADHIASCPDCQQARRLSSALRGLAAPQPGEDTAADARRIWARAAAARRLESRRPVATTPRLAPWSPLLGAVAAIAVVAALAGLAPGLEAADGASLTAGLGLVLGSALVLLLGAGASVALAWDHV